MKEFFSENWQDLLDSALEGLRDGMIIGALVLLLFAAADLITHAEATFTIVRDLRGELRSAVGAKEATEE